MSVRHHLKSLDWGSGKGWSILQIQYVLYTYATFVANFPSQTFLLQGLMCFARHKTNSRMYGYSFCKTKCKSTSQTMQQSAAIDSVLYNGQQSYSCKLLQDTRILD